MTLEDETAVMAYRTDPRLSRFLAHPPLAEGDYAVWHAGRSAEIDLRNPGDRRFPGIEPASSGELIGDVLLRRAPEVAGQGEIGMILHADATGKGYAVEAGGAILRAAFEGLGFHRVIGRADELNVPSRRGMERLCMRLEGRHTESERRGSRWINSVLYAILHHEWRASQRGQDSPPAS